jgi:methionyl-tRNA synthetase
MECPHCGEKTRDGKTCESCGKELAPSQGVEVKYKDFKISELLDIKLRKQVPAGQEIPEPETRQMKQKAKSSAGKKRSGVVVTVVLIAVTAAVFFLLRFLLKF